MTWLIDFAGYSLSNAPPVRMSMQTTSILQNHYPERLGLAVCYHPPMIFQITWKVRLHQGVLQSLLQHAFGCQVQSSFSSNSASYRGLRMQASSEFICGHQLLPVVVRACLCLLVFGVILPPSRLQVLGLGLGLSDHGQGPFQAKSGLPARPWALRLNLTLPVGNHCLLLLQH